MNIAIGTDHRGFALKNEIERLLTHMPDNKQIKWLDVGCFSDVYCDYPIAAKHVVDAIRNKQADVGVLLCGTGVGMTVAANRFAHIYAALVWTEELARLARQHDNANILVLPADYITASSAIDMVRIWLTATFEGGRHQHRIEEIDSFEGM